MMSRRCRKLSFGFTLIELLVVISIIGMLAAMLLPALQSARDTARRIACNNSMKQLSLATVNFETTRDRFPGSRENLGSTAAPWPVSWQTVLMPYMERNDIFDLWQEYAQQATPSNPPGPYQYLKMLRCQSDPPMSVGQGTQSYICNAGYVGSDLPTEGVFLDMVGAAVPPTVQSSSMRDGTSNTLLISENLLAQVWNDVTPVVTNPSYKPSNCFVWQLALDQGQTASNPLNAGLVATGVAPNMKINGARSTTAVPATPPITSSALLRPSSNHPGVVNCSFADGHTQILRDNIQYYVYQQLMTPNHKKSANVPNWGYVLQSPDYEN